MKYGFLRCAAVVTKTAVGNLEKNTDNIIDMIQTAQASGVQIAAFPELCITSYTLGDLFRQREVLKQAEIMLQKILDETKDTELVCVVGVPVIKDDKLYNTAAVIQKGGILGVVPKSHIPNYSEYYEQRWFTAGAGIMGQDIKLCGQAVPFGTDILFQCSEFDEIIFGIELCEDLWAPFPPHAYQAMSGSLLTVNISASNELAGKAEYREDMIKHQSGRFISAYLYVSAGPGESTTDTVFGGHAILAENGYILTTSKRFDFENQMVIQEFDLHRLIHDRMLKNTFSYGGEKPAYRKAAFSIKEEIAVPKYRKIDQTPFVPDDEEKRARRCEEVFNIQVTALIKRMRHANVKRPVIGVSGGLDSALALLVASEAAIRLGMAPKTVLGVVMPGFGSTDQTQDLARRLTLATGAELKEISIADAAKQHLEDIDHPEGATDITYENAQARERTQVLMDLANQTGGMVIGTGDLSELALGFCTYAGDQISMYGVNAGVAKTLIREIVRWASKNRSEELYRIANEIIAIPPSPELLPPGAADKDKRQMTEKQIGPYELNDFFMYYMLRFEMTPEKILCLAQAAFGTVYEKKMINNQLKLFYKRFFASQFKRSCMPDGPKVGSVSLSPRGDWRMPSDAEPDMWLKRLE